MTTSKVATEFHTWLQDAAMAEEFFFATIARIDQKQYRETGNVIQGKIISKENKSLVLQLKLIQRKKLFQLLTIA
jgi:hypothetical protein